MRTLVVVLFLCVVCCICSSAIAARPSKADVKRDFDRIIAARQGIISSTQMKAAQYGSDFPDQALIDFESVEFVKKFYAPNVSQEIAEGYREVFRSELTSTNPVYRGLACEFLALKFDPKTVEALGKLLDDKEKSAVQLGRVTPQMVGRGDDPSLLYYKQPVVGQLAAYALEKQTGINFVSTSQFNEWWNANKDYTNRLWYWSASWTFRYIAKPVGADGKSIPMDMSNWLYTYKADFTGFSDLDAETGLKFLLLYRYASFVQTEASLVMGPQAANPIPKARSAWNGGISAPNREFITKYVQEHNLKGRMIELLNQNNLYPEVDSNEAFRLLSWDILGTDVFDAGDEEALASAQHTTSPFNPSVDRLAAVRAELVPEQGGAILAETLKQNPQNNAVAREMVTKYGSENADLLLNTFKLSYGDSRRDFALAVLKAAEDGRTITPLFIVDLITALDPPSNRGDDDKKGYASDRALVALAKAANVIMKKEVASEEEMNAAAFGWGKGSVLPYEEQKAHDAKVPEAFEVLRSKLLAALR